MKGNGGVLFRLPDEVAFFTLLLPQCPFCFLFFSSLYMHVLCGRLHLGIPLKPQHEVAMRTVEETDNEEKK